MFNKLRLKCRMDYPNLTAKGLVVLAFALGSLEVATGQAAKNPVTYEAFGAVGDGLTDDMLAIQKAHEHANQHGLPVRSKPDATYHLGGKSLTAIIATDTDWGTSKFIIDDSSGVENSRKPLFKIESLLKPILLKIDRLKRGQTQLDIRPESDCLVYVENKNKKLFIRKGGNQNTGTAQKEVFVLKKDGSIIGEIYWDYDVITEVIAQPIDANFLHVRGGVSPTSQTR